MSVQRVTYVLIEYSCCFVFFVCFWFQRASSLSCSLPFYFHSCRSTFCLGCWRFQNVFPIILLWPIFIFVYVSRFSFIITWIKALWSVRARSNYVRYRTVLIVRSTCEVLRRIEVAVTVVHIVKYVTIIIVIILSVVRSTYVAYIRNAWT